MARSPQRPDQPNPQTDRAVGSRQASTKRLVRSPIEVGEAPERCHCGTPRTCRTLAERSQGIDL